jgi:subtilisin-like proprotein convertase family protein
MEPITEHLNKCQLDCSSLDAVIYDGNRIDIPDNHKVSSAVFVTDHRPIQSVDVVINGMYHRNPQDLTMFLVPPSGNKVLLFANHKISNYRPGFSFAFSDQAPSGHYINNAFDGDSCRILNRVNSIRYDNGDGSSISTSNEVLSSSFDHLVNYVPASGYWSLDIFDNDLGSSGVIDDWKLLIRYQDIIPTTQED